MRKRPTPELCRRIEEHREDGRRARASMQQVIDKADAALAARRDREQTQSGR